MISLYNRSIIKTPSLIKLVEENQRSLFTSVFPNLFRATPLLCAEPLKKKKKIDPAIVKAREDRKKKRVEKEIRRLEKNALQFKPIEELEVSSEIKNSLEMRTRKNPELSMEERDARHLLLKKWNQFKFEQHKQDLAMINRVLRAKEIALQELKEESEELYNEAIQLDLVLLPFRCKGPVSTPAIPGFVPVDGDYFDKTKNWD